MSPTLLGITATYSDCVKGIWHQFFLNKYVGVQSWKAALCQLWKFEWNRIRGCSGKKGGKIARAKNRTRELAICVVFSSRQIRQFWFCAVVGRETAEKEAYENRTWFSLRSNLVVSCRLSPPREDQVLLCSFWPNLTKSAFSQTRYTDSVLASLEPRLFHSKLILKQELNQNNFN